MLYTLGIFALEPLRWINQFEWRRLTDLEMCACGTFWKHMGDAMEISYDKLPSSSDGWRDGLDWLQELMVWCTAYEEAHMLPAKPNKRLSDAQLDILLPKWPAWLSRVAHKTAIILLGERLRQSMM